VGLSPYHIPNLQSHSSRPFVAHLGEAIEDLQFDGPIRDSRVSASKKVVPAGKGGIKLFVSVVHPALDDLKSLILAVAVDAIDQAVLSSNPLRPPKETAKR
jgi:hypothetical protein